MVKIAVILATLLLAGCSMKREASIDTSASVSVPVMVDSGTVMPDTIGAEVPHLPPMPADTAPRDSSVGQGRKRD